MRGGDKAVTSEAGSLLQFEMEIFPPSNISIAQSLLAPRVCFPGCSFPFITTQHFTLLSQPSPFLREIVSGEYCLELRVYVGAVKCIWRLPLFFVPSPPVCYAFFQPWRKDSSVLHRLSCGSLKGKEERWTCKWSGRGAGGEGNDFEREQGTVDCSDGFWWTVLLHHWIQVNVTAQVHITASLSFWLFHILLTSFAWHCFLCTNFNSPPVD